MTEKEAKGSICPIMSAKAHGGYDPVYAMCIGEACMAFRWVPDITTILSGNEIIVDQEDEDFLDGLWWDGKYARSKIDRLHRLIATRVFGKIPDDMFVDHIDGNKMNNRRGNIRIVTKAQNAANSASRGGISKYRGVHRLKTGKWSAQIAQGKIRITLGTFDTEDEAAAKYDEAAKNIHGEYARFNLQPVKYNGRKCYCGLAGAP